MDGKLIDLKQLTTIANLPSKEELIAKLLYVLNAQAQRIVTAINAVPRDLAVVIKQIGDQKPADGAAPVAEAAPSEEAPAAEAAPAEEAPAVEAAEAPAEKAAADVAAEPVETATEAQEEVVAAAPDDAAETAVEAAPEAEAEEKAE